MNTTATTKIMVAVGAALLITSGAVRHFTREDVQTVQPKEGERPATAVAKADASQPAPDIARTPAAGSRRTVGLAPVSGEAKAPRAYDVAPP